MTTSKILSLLSKNQISKLEKDYNKQLEINKSTLEKINNMLETGYYNNCTCKWLRKLKCRYTINIESYIKNNYMNYMAL